MSQGSKMNIWLNRKILLVLTLSSMVSPLSRADSYSNGILSIDRVLVDSDVYNEVKITVKDLIENKMSKEIDKVLDSIKDLKEHLIDKNDKIEERLTALERWRWILVGAVFVAAVLIPEMPNFLAFLLN